MQADPRIPVIFASSAQAGPADALLIEVRGLSSAPLSRDQAATEVFATARKPVHSAACACCAPRNAVAEALGRLFLAQMRGTIPFFHRVIAVTSSREGEDAVRSALSDDTVAAARFRLGDPQSGGAASPIPRARCI
jgi:hypothetical protein